MNTQKDSKKCACPDHWDGKPAAPQSSPLPCVHPAIESFPGFSDNSGGDAQISYARCAMCRVIMKPQGPAFDAIPEKLEEAVEGLEELARRSKHPDTILRAEKVGHLIRAALKIVEESK